MEKWRRKCPTTHPHPSWIPDTFFSAFLALPNVFFVVRFSRIFNNKIKNENISMCYFTVQWRSQQHTKPASCTVKKVCYMNIYIYIALTCCRIRCHQFCFVPFVCWYKKMLTTLTHLRWKLFHTGRTSQCYRFRVCIQLFVNRETNFHRTII